MYCTYCNHPNPEGNKFCENCGKPLARQQQASPPSPQLTAQPTPHPSQTSWARRLASIGGAIVIYGFFLPWLLVSCSLDVNKTSGIKVSGYEIASGNYKITQNLNQLGTLFGGNTYTPSGAETAYPLLAAIPLLGVIGLIALNGRVSGSVVAITTGLLGIGGMVIFSIVAVGYGSQLSQSMLLQLSFREGFWVTWFGFIWQVIVAIMTVRQRR
jgi:hypothetical protein